MERSRKIMLLYNPHSGNGSFHTQLDLVVEACQRKGFQLVPFKMLRDSSYDSLLLDLKSGDYEKIIIAGGDGTINICVNKMLDLGINLPIALFPIGTANDFATCLHIPRDLKSMIAVALDDVYANVDVGTCNDKYFINVAAFGQLADVSQKTDPALKHILGVYAYYIKGLSEIMSIKPRRVKITTPEKVYDEEIFFLAALNGGSAGGFDRLAPKSEVSDGLLDVIFFKKMPKMNYAPLFFNVLMGNHEENEYVVSMKASELLIESEDPIATDIDGEYGESLPIKLGIVEKKLRIAVPR